MAELRRCGWHPATDDATYDEKEPLLPIRALGARLARPGRVHAEIAG